MNTHLDKLIEELRLKVIEMAALAEKSVERSLKAAFERNTAEAEYVIEHDCDVNELQYDIDEMSLRLLATDQPVARDLRMILGCATIAANLERVGDQGVNISERALLLSERPAMPHNPLVEELSDIVTSMLRTALQAFTQGDAEMAQKVCEMDARADTVNYKILKHYVDFMVEESRSVERAVHLIILARCLERIGDLATNIAESTIFILKGVDVRKTCHPY